MLDKHIEIDALHRDGHELPVELSITRTEQFREPVFLGFCATSVTRPPFLIQP